VLAPKGPQEQSLRRWRFGGVSTAVIAGPQSLDPGSFVQAYDDPRVRAAKEVAVAWLSRKWNCDEIRLFDFMEFFLPLREKCVEKRCL
jgi:hypothetical protein